MLAAIDRSVENWRSGADLAYAQVMRHWGGQDPGVQISPWVWRGLAGLVAFSLLAALMVAILRRQVQERTRHLRDSEQKLATILDSVGAFIYIKGNSISPAGMFQTTSSKSGDVSVNSPAQFMG